MITVSSYFKNVQSSTAERNKRRLSSEEDSECNNYKKRAISVGNWQQNDDISRKTRTSASNSDDCLNEEVLINNLEKFLKQTLDFSSITMLCSTEDFSQLHPNTTQAVSNLTSQPYIGLMEQDKLTVLLDFLLKLHQSKGTLPKFQEKSKIWAITQLKKSLCLPTSILFEKEYFHPATLQSAVTKVIAVIANEKYRKQKIPKEIIHILSLVGLVALKMPILPSSKFIESLLQILFDNKQSLPILHELMELLNMLIIEEKFDISSESLSHLWTLHPSSLEDIVVDILTENKTQGGRRMVKSKLGQACCYNSALFQKVVNMFVSAWLQTGGDSGIVATLSTFTYLVQNTCISTSLFSLFPNSLWPLILLLQIPTTELSPTAQKLHAYSINATLLEMVSNELCQIKDIIILFLMFPSWYQVLHNLSTSEPSNNTGILKLLVNADQ